MPGFYLYGRTLLSESQPLVTDNLAFLNYCALIAGNMKVQPWDQWIHFQYESL